MKLTDIQCKAAKPAAKPYKLSDGKGLYLLVHPNGSKYWRYNYRFSKKSKIFSFGVYPETSLAEVRDKHHRIHKEVKDGKEDPSLIKKQQKLQSQVNSKNTFKSIALEWHKRKTNKWGEKTAKKNLARLENDIFPAIGNWPITDIEARFLRETIEKVQARGAHELPRRLVGMCSNIFKYAISKGIEMNNPALSITDDDFVPYTKTHFKTIEFKELPEFIKALKTNNSLYPITKYAVELIMLTFVRTKELRYAEWSEIDFDNKIWLIPAQKMKMRKDHLVPLSKQSISILRQLQAINGDYPHIFASPIRPKNIISENTILKAIERMGYKGKMTGHGFRALAMTAIKEQLNYRHEVIDRQLAHAPASKIVKAYDRADFLEDRKEMMQKWADLIDSLY